MEIILAKEAGFCFGVKRAIDLCVKSHDDGISFVTFGEIIHNKQVVSSLEKMGIHAVESFDNLDKQDVLIRSHGISKALYEEAKNKGVQLIDGTCPYVKKIQNIAAKYSAEGYEIIIVGDKDHPEVIGVSGWSQTPVHVVYSAEETTSLNFIKKACIVAQATITESKWNEVMSAAQSKVQELLVFNTICEATRERQASADKISKEVDVMLIIGGKHSSNTKKLLEVCEKNCKKAYHIETIIEIEQINFENCDKIGITAGASTPDWIINEILNALKKMH